MFLVQQNTVVKAFLKGVVLKLVLKTGEAFTVRHDPQD